MRILTGYRSSYNDQFGYVSGYDDFKTPWLFSSHIDVELLSNEAYRIRHLLISASHSRWRNYTQYYQAMSDPAWVVAFSKSHANFKVLLDIYQSRFVPVKVLFRAYRRVGYEFPGPLMHLQNCSYFEKILSKSLKFGISFVLYRGTGFYWAKLFRM